jgi:hypothetical protein
MGVLGVNHIAFRSHDPVALRRFYLELMGGESLDAVHDPIRMWSSSDNDPPRSAGLSPPVEPSA